MSKIAVHSLLTTVPKESPVSHCPLVSQPDISTELFWSREPHCSYKNNSFQVRNNTGIISNKIASSDDRAVALLEGAHVND